MWILFTYIYTVLEACCGWTVGVLASYMCHYHIANAMRALLINNTLAQVSEVVPKGITIVIVMPFRTTFTPTPLRYGGNSNPYNAEI